MLQQLRTNMKVLWIILICFPFGFVYLLSGRHAGGTDAARRNANNIATVNGAKIPADLYNRYVGQLAENQRQQFHRDELTTQDYERIEAEAWDELIRQELLSQEAHRLDIQVPDEEIVGMLTQNPPAFIKDRFKNDKGEFDAEAFQKAVNNPQYPWLQDEQYLRAVLPTLKLQQMVRAQATVSEEEVRREFARRTQRTKVRYTGVTWPSIQLAGFAPTEADLRKFYDTHPERFQRGETVVLDLVRLDKKPSPADEAELDAELKQIVQKAQDPTLAGVGPRNDSFAVLAQESSEDPSAEHGGDIGWVTPGRLPKPVEEAAWKLEPGQTSDAVRTEKALYVVHVDSARTNAAGQRELKLRQIFMEAKPSPDTVDSLRAHVQEAAKVARKDFGAAARELGTKVERLEPIEHTGFLPGIGFSKRLADWAFAARPGEVSEPIATDQAFLLARLVEKHGKGPLPFEKVHDQVRSMLEEDLKKERARQQVEKVVARIAQGATLAAAARAEGLQVQDPAPFAYYESVPGVGSANEFTAVATALEPGQTSGVVETSNGAFALEAVSRDPFDEKAYQGERDNQYRSLLSRREMEAYDAWYQALRDRAAIEDHRSPRV